MDGVRSRLGDSVNPDGIAAVADRDRSIRPIQSIGADQQESIDPSKSRDQRRRIVKIRLPHFHPAGGKISKFFRGACSGDEVSIVLFEQKFDNTASQMTRCAGDEVGR